MIFDVFFHTYFSICIVDCGDPPTPAHGKVTLTINGETSYGSTATQACNPGFDLSGSAYISCKDDKSWSAPPVICSIIGMYFSKKKDVHISNILFNYS